MTTAPLTEAGAFDADWLLQRIALAEIGYHVAGRLAGVEDPHGLYAQRQAEFEAELAAAQDGESER